MPVDLARRALGLLRRIRWLCEKHQTPPLSLVIGHNDRGSLFDAALKRMCKRYAVRLVSGAFYRGDINNARLRNEAMAAVTAPLTLLLDADLVLTDAALTSAAASILNGAFPFRVLPCLYLSRQGTRDLLHRGVDPQTLLDAYLRFKRGAFLHMALPSSVVLFRTQDFHRSGRFDTGFSGHGYEDFDFLLRLAWLHELVPRTPDLLTDCPSRAPLLLRGFRAHLARLALPGMLRNEFACHCWHAAPKDAYYAARARNARRLSDAMMAQIDASCDTAQTRDRAIDIPLLHFWLGLCDRHGKDPRDYLILFDGKPGHTDRLDTMRRKIGFLLGKD